MRASSLTNLGVAVDYNISSDYDKVLVVAEVASEIEALAPFTSEIATIAANMPDVVAVAQAVEIIDNLSVKLSILEPGSQPSSALVGGEIQLGIPEVRGPKGADGMTPQLEFSVDVNGNLVYEVVNYVDIVASNNVVEEW